ncbi:phospholipid transport system transporter-binding protein [Modicisalibacter muralis]|uniref:Phospholipid transport system transporter-binding protein n=1 Tax=Modicisalibacter muralis TaxID=119000 RepID=A0A1G9LBQ7_9GAMM|nr:STAS domain-containing protein [Halomonas muralis]SDL59380.1 phospholipid transport system transporter-binding protein [Halomonas muralis]
MKVLLDLDGVHLEVDGSVLAASGEADFDAAAALAASGCEWLREQPVGSAVCFDLCGVNRASSAALSVMLEWLRCVRDQRLEVEAVRLSPPLARLTAMAGLDRLLSLETPTPAL